MINHISKFFLLFVFIILFLSFKNQIKIIENDLTTLKKNYYKNSHNFIEKEILLTKQKSQLQNSELKSYEHIENNNITITEVNVSPDLKNAKVYVMPLGGENKMDVLNSLNKATGRLKKIISRKISLRQIPRLVFSIDETFEQAKKINDILGKIKK